MKNLIKKSMGIVLVLIISLSSFSGCIDNSLFHAHSFEQKMDTSRHFMECSCGEIKDSAEHTFEWVVDSEPTYTAPGYKHKECATCTYKVEKNTIIERMLHETVIYNDEIESLVSNTLVWHEFKCYKELENYYNENKNEQSYSFYCINPVGNDIEGVEIVDTPTHSTSFYYGSDEIDTCLVDVCFSLLCEEFGPSELLNGIGGVEITIEFRFISLGCNSNFENITFDFYKYEHPKYKWNHVIKLTDSGEKIGYVYFLTDLDISKEWIVKYITSNMMILK